MIKMQNQLIINTKKCAQLSIAKVSQNHSSLSNSSFIVSTSLISVADEICVGERVQNMPIVDRWSSSQLKYNLFHTTLHERQTSYPVLWYSLLSFGQCQLSWSLGISFVHNPQIVEVVDRTFTIFALHLHVTWCSSDM